MKIFTIKKLLLGLILLFLALLCLITVSLFIYIFLPGLFEDKIRHVGYTPPKNSERASVVMDRDIGNKGKVRIFWWPDGSLAISNIGTYTTTFSCFYISSDGSKGKYMGTSELFFGQNSPYKKWFPFEVKKIPDLIGNYDAIINVIKTFPKKPDFSYAIEMRAAWGKKVTCDLIQQKIVESGEIQTK